MIRRILACMVLFAVLSFQVTFGQDSPYLKTSPRDSTSVSDGASRGGLLLYPFARADGRENAPKKGLDTRIEIHGTLDQAIIGQGVSGNAVDNAARIGLWRAAGNPNYHRAVLGKTYEFLAGKPMESNGASCFRGDFNLSMKASPTSKMGAKLVLWGRGGDFDVAHWYGVTPPHQQGYFTGFGAGDMQFAFDNVWLESGKEDFRITIGSFQPKFVGGYVLAPKGSWSRFGPRIIEDYGASVWGKIKPFRYELMWFQIYDRSPFYSSAWVAHLDAEVMKNVTVGLDYMTAENFAADNQPAGVFIPGRRQLWTGTAIAWDPDGAAGPIPATQILGPQKQTTFGFHVKAGDPKKLSGVIETASTQYQPWKNPGAMAAATGSAAWAANPPSVTASASMFRAMAQGKHQQFFYSADYMTVDPRYDAFTIRMPVVPAFTNPDSPLPRTLIPTYYYGWCRQLHADGAYPNNRMGFKLRAGYKFLDPQGKDEKDRKELGEVSLGYNSFLQKESSTPANMISPGFIEPYFPTLTGGEDITGNIKNWELLLKYKFDRLGVNLEYSDYTSSRSSAVSNNNINIRTNLFLIGLKYDWSKKCALKAGYDTLSTTGQWMTTGGDNWGLNQYSPYLGVDYRLNKDIEVNLEYKGLTTQDKIGSGNTNADWSGTLFTAEVKAKF